jgi:hypothetical protein
VPCDSVRFQRRDDRIPRQNSPQRLLLFVEPPYRAYFLGMAPASTGLTLWNVAHGRCAPGLLRRASLALLTSDECASGKTLCDRYPCAFGRRKDLLARRELRECKRFRKPSERSTCKCERTCFHLLSAALVGARCIVGAHSRSAPDGLKAQIEGRGKASRGRSATQSVQP